VTGSGGIDYFDFIEKILRAVTRVVAADCFNEFTGKGAVQA
jgi:hypothetical protein